VEFRDTCGTSVNLANIFAVSNATEKDIKPVFVTLETQAKKRSSLVLTCLQRNKIHGRKVLNFYILLFVTLSLNWIS
jgi:hypothetical protein